MRKRHDRCVDKREIDRWLKGFVSELGIDDERVPLERVVASRLDGFIRLRDQGLTWRSIAALIARSGGRRRDGSSISGDQLRAAVARRLARRPALEETSPAPVKPHRRRALPTATGTRSNASHSQTDSAPSIRDVSTDKDVSNAEIVAALARINKRV